VLLKSAVGVMMATGNLEANVPSQKNHPKLPSGGFKAMAKLGMADTAFPVASDQWTAPSLPTPPFHLHAFHGFRDADALFD